MILASMEAIVLAGGLGTRLREAVPDLPKPMAPINGRPFLEYQLDYWIEQGVSHFILSVGYKHELISRHFGPAYRGVPVAFVVESEPLGTGGGLVLASRMLSPEDPVLVLNGDTYFAVELKSLLEFHLDRNADVTLALFRTPEDGRYMGIQIDCDGSIRSLKTAAGERGGLANGGVYLFRRGFFESSSWQPGQRLSLEDDILGHALESGKRIVGLEVSAKFIDIGVPGDYARAGAFLAA